MNLTTRMMTSVALAASLLFAGSGAQADQDESGTMDDKPSIVDIALSNGDFSTLVAALEAADLVDVLSGEGPFTVFAPTNAAFDKLPEGTVESLLKTENKQKLTDVLTYHVISGKVYASEVAELSEATTVQGSTLDITVTDGNVMVDNASVVATDIKASNGVIHVIDTVIMP